MTPWTMVEPCAGSAAVTYHLLGAKRAVLPFQGSKWRYRRAIESLIRKNGFTGPPAEVVLTDRGPWGPVHRLLIGDGREEVIRYLESFDQQDAECVYLALQGHGASRDPALRAAEFLFLQRLAFSGKAVGLRDGRWVSAGFNRSSAYGIPATDKFGAVKPMIKSLITVLESYADLHRPIVSGGQFDAGDFQVVDKRTFVLLDPPYAGTTPYPGASLPRERVVELALRWRDAGAVVCVCEAWPIQELVDVGFQASQVDSVRKDGSPFKSKKAEYLTSYP